jgi:hypothetical protein
MFASEFVFINTVIATPVCGKDNGVAAHAGGVSPAATNVSPLVRLRFGVLFGKPHARLTAHASAAVLPRIFAHFLLSARRRSAST